MTLLATEATASPSLCTNTFMRNTRNYGLMELELTELWAPEPGSP